MAPPAPSLRILVVDDSEHDARLMALALKRGGMVAQTQRVDTPGDLAQALGGPPWDAVLADHSMPQLDSFGVLEAVKRVPHPPPVVIVSGQIGEETLARAMRAGASDYLSKDHFALLPATLQRILDARRAQRELEEAQWLLHRQEKLAALATFVRGVSHEINNPLSYVFVNLEIADQDLRSIRERVKLAAEDRGLLDDSLHAIEVTRRGVDRIALVARGLQRLSRASEAERASVDFNDLVTRSMPPLPARVRLDLQLLARASVRVSESDLRDTLQALVHNACEAMAEKPEGHLVVRTRDLGDDRVALDVEDDGVGMSEAVQREVFTPFFTTKPGGVGLSLSIVRGLLADHDGTIRFDSAPGQGTRFHVELPRLSPFASVGPAVPVQASP